MPTPPRLFSLTLLVLLSTLSLLSAACLSTAPRPGTGDVAFRLRWESDLADLDLSVQEPEGTWVNFMFRRSKAGGFLDVDCHASPRDICKHPVENVYWPTGQAPEGRYRFRVRLFQFLPVPVEVAEGEGPPPPPEPPADPVPFTVEVLEGRKVVERHQGSVSWESRNAELEYLFVRTPGS